MPSSHPHGWGRLMVRIIGRITGILVVCALTGWVSTGQPRPPSTWGVFAQWVGGLVAAGADRMVTWGSAHPKTAAALFTVAGAAAVMSGVRAWVRVHTPRDPIRAFTRAQREEGFTRCQGRCERSGIWLFTRCPRAAVHADHWFPHSKGGRTQVYNLVGSCQWHNLTKSGAWPSWWETHRIGWRRRAYWSGPGEERIPVAHRG